MSAAPKSVPGCVVCIVSATPPPSAPAAWFRLPSQLRDAKLLEAGIAGGASTATVFVFVYGVEAVRAALCREHRTSIETMEAERKADKSEDPS